MPIRVVLADDSDIIRGAIVRVLSEEAAIEVVGEAASFAEAIERNASLKPHVLLLDIHMPDEDEYPPDLVKAQIHQHNSCLIAMSISNDEQARALADSFGAKVFLDKMSLYTTLIPAIKSCVTAPEKPLRHGFKRATAAGAFTSRIPHPH